MKHIGRVSKALPAPAYLVPRNIFEISSPTDIVIVIALAIEKFFRLLGGSVGTERPT